MASTSETGHYKNIRGMETLLTYIADVGAIYNPITERLKTASLTQLVLDANSAMTELRNAVAQLKIHQSLRQDNFATLVDTASRVVSAMRSCEMDHSLIAEAESTVAKMRGKRRTAAAPKTEEGTEPKTKSVSHASFDMMVDHFSKLVALVSQGTYQTNESEIRLPELNQKLDFLKDANNKVTVARSILEDKLSRRDEVLYKPRTGLVDTGKDVKDYIKQLYGPANAVYKKFRGVPFRTSPVR